jgi:hypothetical protein
VEQEYFSLRQTQRGKVRALLSKLSGLSPTEIVMTLIVGAASVTGLGVSFRWPTNLTWGNGLATAALLVVLPLVALRISSIPYIASH